MPTNPPSAPAAASRETTLGGPLSGSPILIIMLTAFAVLLPTFFLGIPSGHDFEFHLNSWMEVLGQWRLGILYPRWAALAHFGYGEARFIFYPPASWMLGAALGSFLPWKIVPGFYEWIALTLSGASMFLLARRFLARRDAIFAAALYAANPYYIVIVYWRSACAELLAGALLPVLLLAVLRSERLDRKSILPLSLIVAAAWLTNIPSAVMLTYSLALLLMVVAMMRRSWQPLAIGAVAFLLGLALAAFYVVPVLYEQKWVEIAQVLSPGVRPQDNFIFTSLHDPDHDRFNLLISLLSVAEIVLLAISCFLSRAWRTRAAELWWTLSAWSAACALLLFSFSLALYRFLPELRYVQLPLRWLLCLNVGFALFVAMASQRWLFRAFACLLMLAVLGLVWHRVQHPWWDDAGDVAEMLDNQQNGSGYEGIDEYVPDGVDVYEIKKDARRVTFAGNGSSRIRITQWGPESKLFDANVSQPGHLVLKLFNYPAWKVEVNHRAVATGMLDVTGQMVVPVEAGENRVRVTFTRTRDREIGGWISFGTGILVLGVVFFKRRGQPLRP
ncbi:MAG: 6-pyruvoyl-tetrahydropterin synthase-related protein [Terriglobales bacterium]